MSKQNGIRSAFTYQANFGTWLQQAKDHELLLDTHYVYNVHVEALTGKRGAYDLWHKYRDRYAESLGPADQFECKQLLKWRYGPHLDVAEVQVYTPPGSKTPRAITRWKIDLTKKDELPDEMARTGRFYVFMEQGITSWLVSINEYLKDELLSSMEGIKGELVSNGIDISDLTGPPV